MKLSDLTEAPLDPNNPIDRELKKTANDVKKDGSLDQKDIDAQDDPMINKDSVPDSPENVPDAPVGSESPVTDTSPPKSDDKPVDPELLAIVQNHNYIRKYDHKVDGSSSPITIMNMDMSELSQLRNKIRVSSDRIGLEDKIGMYSDPKTEAIKDMLSFVDTVMGFKKANAIKSPAQKTASSKANFNSRPTRDAKPTKQFKVKK